MSNLLLMYECECLSKIGNCVSESSSRMADFEPTAKQRLI